MTAHELARALLEGNDYEVEMHTQCPFCINHQDHDLISPIDEVSTHIERNEKGSFLRRVIITAAWTDIKTITNEEEE